jgi:hypothetical protein
MFFSALRQLTGKYHREKLIRVQLQTHYNLAQLYSHLKKFILLIKLF